MKRFFAIISCLLCVVLLTACGTSMPVGTDGSTPTTTTESKVPDGIRNIIIVIGDGMGDAQIRAGELASDRDTVYHSWNMIKSNTNSLNDQGDAEKTTDSAAGGTALATGQLTKNSRVGRDEANHDLKNIMEYAQEFGKATGVISTDSVFGATPATFSAHCSDREDSLTIMYSQMASNIDLFCANAHTKTQELKSFITGAGYTYITVLPEISKNMDQDKLFCQLPMAGSSPDVTLEALLPTALDYLDQDADGFVLMVEQAHIDKYSHENNISGTESCANMLNDGVSAILQWMGDRDDTAILITADHETGGLNLGVESDGYSSYISPSGDTLYYCYTSTAHTPTPVSIYTYGFTPDWSPYYLDETGTIVKNTAVFHMAYDLLKNPIR